MDKGDIKLSDINRILIGDAPMSFMAEVFIRTLISYIVLLVIVRLLGKRMAGQLTITEMSVMLTLGAIIAPAMQMPDRGILITIMALICIVLMQREINWLGFRNEKIELITNGKISLLIEDGIIKTDELRRAKVSLQHYAMQN